MRNTDTVYYGKIEMAMALLCVAIESDPPNHTQMRVQFDELKTMVALTIVATSSKKPPNRSIWHMVWRCCAQGCWCLGLMAGGQAKLGEFIQI
ncbi:MAG: hypothetical protein Q4A69_05785 [Moraxella sp.]|nr:hypothetical protein [Moraxella sp.]